MASPSIWLYRRILGLGDEDVRFARRGFTCDDPAARRRLERVGETVVAGCRAALEIRGEAGVAAAVAATEPELRGFAFEGAAMGLALLDRLTPWRRGRWASFLRGPGDPHAYMVHVGAGLALARLRRGPAAPLGSDPLLAPLIADGCGFHEGYFRWSERAGGRPHPRSFRGYSARAFDQGLGRSLWFVRGASARRIAEAIEEFPESRRADLWAGVGLACAYAGGVERSAIEDLSRLAALWRPELAQGASFASQARRRAGNPAAHTELACRVLCGCSADEAADIAVRSLAGLPPDGERPAYEVWRERVRSRFIQREVA